MLPSPPPPLGDPPCTPAVFAAAAASRTMANCARSAQGWLGWARAGAVKGGPGPWGQGLPRGNYRHSRRRPPGQRLRAAAEINWRRQRGQGRPEPGRAHIDRPRGRQLAEAARAGAAGAGAAIPGRRGTKPAARVAQQSTGSFRPAAHRELSQPPPLLSPQNAPHIALGPHLRPPFLGVPSALCQTPGEQ